MTNTFRILIAGAALALTAGCRGDYLTGGDLTTDPNRPVTATNRQLLVGIEANLWATWGSDPARSTGIFAQQWTGAQSQYQSNIQSYQITEDNTNGLYSGLYGGGGLVDIRKLEAGTLAVGDTLFLGVAQVFEGALMGTGADLFGDIVYTDALKGTPNPALDDQLAVYDAIQTLLSQAITNLQATGPTNIGPGSADLTYGGDAASFIALAHTLKARFYMHTAEVRPSAYGQALAEAKLGIRSNAGTYVGRFFDASGQQNFYYQFEVTAGRHGYVVPNPNFVALLQSRNDPRRTDYFNAAGDDLSDTRIAPDFAQPYVSYDENTLIWAEAAYRTGDQSTALVKLNEERANHGLAAETVSGNALLTEILTEKYIASFELAEEAFNDYNRTCFPNLVPTGAQPGPIPARFYYDASERQTDTNIPQPGTGVNILKNPDNPPNAISDGTGAVCLGQ
jgi:starch-binding outer membrane protein, SusD/RagB family